MASVRKAVFVLVAATLAVLGQVTLPGTAMAASTGNVGFGDQTFSGVPNSPTSDKPQSKLWYVNGQWWSVMWAGSGGWHIFRLDRPSEAWIDTGVAVDSRSNTLADALWDGNKLYIASHVVTISSDKSSVPSQPNSPANLYRYSYSPNTNAFSLDSGFPTVITNQSQESLTIDEDSTGTIWATWTQVSGSSTSGYTNQVYVNATTSVSGTWATPLALPVTGSNPAPDDISAIVAFRGYVGVLWSNQNTGSVYWALHKDGNALSSWAGGPAVASGNPSTNPLADDHLNIKSLQSSSTGQVFAVFKTSLDETYFNTDQTQPQIRVASYTLGASTWNVTTFGTIADCHTRPQLVLDNQNSLVYVVATAPTASGCPYSGYAGSIYYKSAPMSTLVFPSGRGTQILHDSSSDTMNNVTTSKQMVNNSTGLVAMASTAVTSSSGRYWHADLVLGNPTSAPTASFTASPTSGGAPLTVAFTDKSSGSPTSWLWDFGDGATSPAQNPSHTYQTAGTYTVKLVATNSVGASTAVTQTITVATTPTASFTANPTSGTAPLAVTFKDTSTGSPTSWSWNFGDGQTSTQQNPSHTYQSAGSYTVTLTVSNSAGSSQPATQGITVSQAAVMPTASFTANPTSGTAPLAVQFTDTSTGGPTSWSWDFGDGQTSTQQNPSHTYQSAGSYNVTLTASNGAGQNTSAPQTITVSPASAGGDPACAGSAAVPSTGVALMTNGTTTSAVMLGKDDGVWYRPIDGSVSSWQTLGGVAQYGPAAVAAGSTSYVFVVGTDNALWYRSNDGSGWSDWTGLGGSLTSAPAAASLGSGHVRVFARGSDGAMWSREFSGGSWGPWTGQGGALSSAPTATANPSASTVTVAVRGTDGNIYEQTLTVGQSAGTYARLNVTACSVLALGAVQSSTNAALGGYLDSQQTPQLLRSDNTSTSLSGTITDNPAIQFIGSGFVVVGRGGDNALWLYDGRTGGPNAWVSLGGVVGPSSP